MPSIASYRVVRSAELGSRRVHFIDFSDRQCATRGSNQTKQRSAYYRKMIVGFTTYQVRRLFPPRGSVQKKFTLVADS